MKKKSVNSVLFRVRQKTPPAIDENLCFPLALCETKTNHLREIKKQYKNRVQHKFCILN